MTKTFYVTVQAGTDMRATHDTFQDYEARGEGNEYKVIDNAGLLKIEPCQWFGSGGVCKLTVNYATLSMAIDALELLSKRVTDAIG